MMKNKIIIAAVCALASGLLYIGEARACAQGECRSPCFDTEKPTGESCSLSAGDNFQTGSCCVKKSGIDLTSGKVCSEDKGMVAGRCFPGGITGCYGIGPGLALGEKGTLGCPSDQICCKTQEYQDATQGKPETQQGQSQNPLQGQTALQNLNSGPENPGGLVPCKNNCTLCHIVIGFQNIFNFFLGLLFIATMLIITVAGVFYMISGGNKGMMDKAKQGLTLSLTAFGIGMGSWLIINLIMNIMGYQHPIGGSWWQFTCDTVQTQGAAVTSSGPSLQSASLNRTPMPTDGTQISNALQQYANVVYGQNGYDCSRYVQAVAVAGVPGWDPGRDTASMLNNSIPFDQSQLVNGTVLVSNNGGGGRHAGFYYNGAVYHLANTGEMPKVSNLNNYMSYASGNGGFQMRLPGT